MFLGYSSVSKAFRVFNLPRKTFEEIARVTLDEGSFIHDQIDHPSSILNEVTYSPSDLVPEFLLSHFELVVPNVYQLINSQPISDD